MDANSAVSYYPFVIASAYLLDLIIGDPERLPHPIRWIGSLIASLERLLLKKTDTPAAKRVKGAILAILVVGIVFGLASFMLWYAFAWSKILFFALATIVCWASLSIFSLEDEARKIARHLSDDDLSSARAQLSRIVGRDTHELDNDRVLKATVESVSENSSDGIIAPLFFFAIGGPALMIAYKAVNTLDSMVGYKNEKYLDFGRFSARLDDAANYVPARLCALLIACVSMLLRYNWRGAVSVVLRDARKHPSPNSGFPEAAMAGALNLRLGGPSSYAGVVVDKSYIGDNDKAIDIDKLKATVRIMKAISLVAVWCAAILWYVR